MSLGHQATTRSFFPFTHGGRITAASQHTRAILEEGQANRTPATLSKAGRRVLAAQIQALERTYVRKGVNFSRTQADLLLRSRDAGDPIEFETLGPYLVDYLASNGTMTLDNLIPEDAIGLQLAALFRSLFPKGRLVSLLDEYNGGKIGAPTTGKDISFSADLRMAFRQSLVGLFKAVGAVPDTAVEAKDYLLVAESQRLADAEHLVEWLEKRGFIQRDDQEIVFINPGAENPLHQKIRLRAKTGRWLCEALDAAGFVRQENLQIVHIVVLPDYMKDQQDRVWELLRVVGVQPDKYHNIFFDPTQDSAQIVQTVRELFLQ